MHLEEMDEAPSPGIMKDNEQGKVNSSRELITANHSAIQEGGEAY